MNTQIRTLGTGHFPSPLQSQRSVFVEDTSRVLVASLLDELQNPPTTFELAGPRRKIFFKPGRNCLRHRDLWRVVPWLERCNSFGGDDPQL